MSNTTSRKGIYACRPKPKNYSYQDFLHEIYGYNHADHSIEIEHSEDNTYNLYGNYYGR